MKKMLLLVLALCFSMVCEAQKYEDVIYLKDGSIVKGMIIEQVPNQEVKIKSGSNTFVYQMDQVDRMAKELKYGEGGLQSGFMGIAELGYGIGVGDFDAHSLKLNVIGSYRFNPFFAVGVGTGMRYYYQEDMGLNESPLLPILGDVRVNFMNNKISPYLAVTGGYAFDLSDGFSAFGYLVNTGIGVTIKTDSRLAFHVGVGYDLQSFIHHYEVTETVNVMGFPFTYTDVKEERANIHALSINVGLSF